MKHIALYGDASIFAVEVEVSANPDEWLFGNVSYVIGGRRIGLHEEGASVRAAIAAVAYTRRGPGERMADELAQKDTVDLHETLVGALYREDEGSLFTADPGRFVVLPNGLDVFDEWRVFLVESGDRGRLFGAKYDGSDFFEQNVPAGYCDEVLKSFQEGVARQYRNILPSAMQWPET